MKYVVCGFPLYYTIYEDAVLTRFVSIKNESEDIVQIHRLLSMSLDLGEQDYDILTLGGAHTEEKNVYRRHLLGDSIVVESSRGTSSPQATPFLGIMRKETTEEQGEVFGANLIYSGNFGDVCNADSMEQLEFSWESTHFSSVEFKTRRAV